MNILLQRLMENTMRVHNTKDKLEQLKLAKFTLSLAEGNSLFGELVAEGFDRNAIKDDPRYTKSIDYLKEVIKENESLANPANLAEKAKDAIDSYLVEGHKSYDGTQPWQLKK